MLEIKSIITDVNASIGKISGIIEFDIEMRNQICRISNDYCNRRQLYHYRNLILRLNNGNSIIEIEFLSQKKIGNIEVNVDIAVKIWKY